MNLSFVVCNLHFISSTQVDTAVTSYLATKFNMEFASWKELVKLTRWSLLLQSRNSGCFAGGPVTSRKVRRLNMTVAGVGMAGLVKRNPIGERNLNSNGWVIHRDFKGHAG